MPSKTGPRIVLVRELKRPVVKPTQLARMIGVTPQRLSNWERGVNEPPGEALVKIAEALDVPLGFFYDDPVDNTQTKVYYNRTDKEDSGPDPALIETARRLVDQSTIRVDCLIGIGAEVWSAKGARRQSMNLFAWLAAERDPVIVAGKSLSPRFPEGTIVVFNPGTYMVEGVYLLLQLRSDPDQRTIRILTRDVGVPGAAAPGDLEAWQVVGVSYAEVHAAETGNPTIYVKPGGLGPRRI